MKKGKEKLEHIEKAAKNVRKLADMEQRIDGRETKTTVARMDRKLDDKLQKIQESIEDINAMASSGENHCCLRHLTCPEEF